MHVQLSNPLFLRNGFILLLLNKHTQTHTSVNTPGVEPGADRRVSGGPQLLADTGMKPFTKNMACNLTKRSPGVHVSHTL